MIEKLYKKYENELNIIKGHMTSALESCDANSEMKMLFKEIINNPGKMLRPLLMLIISGKYDLDKKDELLCTAAGIELLHNSSLILDDMLDEAKIRRGKPTVVSRYGNPVALCVGDYIIAASCKYIMEKGYNASSFELVHAVQRACDGEMIQNLNRGNTSITKETYFSAIEGKTAALFQIACESACRINEKDDDYKEKMSQFGKMIGLIFQLRDDLLDWTKEEKEIGKPVNEDFSKGIYTLPCIYTFNTKYSDDLKKVSKKKRLTNEDYLYIRSLVNKSGGIDYTRSYINDLSKKIKMIIKDIPDKDTRLILNRIVDNLII